MTSSFMDRATPAQEKGGFFMAAMIFWWRLLLARGKPGCLLNGVMHLLTTKDEQGKYGDLRRMLITTFTNDAAAGNAHPAAG